MSAMPTDVLGGVIGLMVIAMAIGAVDLVRQPGWAWKAAGEPKIVCLALVVLLPGVGLAIYVFGARPRWSPRSPEGGPPPSPSSGSPTGPTPRPRRLRRSA